MDAALACGVTRGKSRLLTQEGKIVLPFMQRCCRSGMGGLEALGAQIAWPVRKLERQSLEAGREGSG